MMLEDFGQREKRRKRLGRRKILAEHLLELDRIGVAQLENKADDVVAGRDVGLVGNNRHTGAARVAPGSDHFDDMLFSAGTSE